MKETSVAQLKEQGNEIVSAKYETKISSWTFETPEEVHSREKAVSDGFDNLAALAAEKKPILEDHLARENFNEKQRLRNRQHEDKFEKIKAWIAQKEAYL